MFYRKTSLHVLPSTAVTLAVILIIVQVSLLLQYWTQVLQLFIRPVYIGLVLNFLAFYHAFIWSSSTANIHCFLPWTHFMRARQRRPLHRLHCGWHLSHLQFTELFATSTLDVNFPRPFIQHTSGINFAFNHLMVNVTQVSGVLHILAWRHFTVQFISIFILWHAMVIYSGIVVHHIKDIV